MSKKKRRDRTASLTHECKYYAMGLRHIFGIDEVGRGPWAGPVAAAAVCLPLERVDLPTVLKGVRDSKEMTHLQRVKLSDTIKSTAAAWGIGSASPQEIDEMGIVRATQRAMERALAEATKEKPFAAQCLMIDDMLLPEIETRQVSLVGGDKRSLSIAAASVIAKVWRDAYMVEMDAQYPAYGFALHKGYGTEAHRAALKKHGPTPLHRMLFKPLLTLTSEEQD